MTEQLAAEKALGYFHRGFNCAQSVFAAFAEEVGLSEELALRLAAGSRQSRCESYGRSAREIEHKAKIDRLQTTAERKGTL
jgi:hypothetical protein